MQLLFQYLKNYKLLIFLALLLAAINQTFSLLDPYIFGKIIDRFASRPTDYTHDSFMKGVGLLILAAIGVAMVSRIAKAFQDYVTSLIIQKFGARVYTDGLKHSLKLPFQQFEDQRSGETLNILQKVRADSEKFISNCINVLFASLVGIV
ncbi:MAG: ABC transporter ATP-binding protein, partial [Saprospiraceae bacterium]|nr:ABC transporter ATP-binding protein [Saprospiraceae bacterium]